MENQVDTDRELAKQVGARIRQARLAKGMGLKKLALALKAAAGTPITNERHKRCGLHQNVVRWEKGYNMPRTAQLRLVCEVLGVSADWLLGLQEERKPLIGQLAAAYSPGFANHDEYLEYCSRVGGP